MTKHQLGKWLIAILLGITGFAFLWFRLEIHLFFHIDLMFTSFFVMSALLFCGAWPGLVTALIVYSASFPLYHHPCFFSIMVGEALFLAFFIRRQKSPDFVALATVYWALIGAPMIWVLYHLAMGTQADSAVVFMSKQLINGVLNALLATAVFTLVSALRKERSPFPSYRVLVFNLLLAFALIPALLILVMDIRQEMETKRQATANLVRHVSEIARTNLEEWLRRYQLPVETLAQLIDDPDTTPPEVMQKQVEMMRKFTPDLLRMGVADARSIIVAFSPAQDEAGHSNIGIDVSKTHYANILQERKKTLMPDLRLALIDKPIPIQLILSPIIVEGSYRGYCSGVIDPSSLTGVLKATVGSHPASVTILDGQGMIVASTKKELKMMTPFPQPAGGVFQNENNGVRQWMPGEVAGVSPIQSERKSYFVFETPPDDTLPWRIVVEASAAPMVADLNQLATRRFLLMGLFVLFAVIVARITSSALVTPLRILQKNTGEMHRKIIGGDRDLAWPASHLAEVQSLVDNFRAMGESLLASFGDLKELNRGLEQKVEERAREIKEREENFKILFDQQADNILLLELGSDNVPVIRDVNRSTLSLLGYEKDELAGKSITVIDPAADPQAISKGRIAELLAGRTARFEVEHRCKDGTVRVFECAANLLTLGGRRMILSSERDITEVIRERKEREELQARLQQSQKMEAIGTLAGGIAHDFNNILAAILGYTELAMAENDPGELAKDLQQVKKSGERAKELVMQILAFSRKTDTPKQPVQVSLIVKEALKMLRSSLPTTIEIRQDITTSGMVLADPTQIHQVMMNLCINAYHAMRETGGILAVSLHEVEIKEEDGGFAPLEPGHYIKLEVSDTGCGMTKEVMERVFEPYFTTKKSGEGTGLGLAVVHGVVKSCNGNVSVYSEPGHGTSFHVYLPLVENPKIVSPTQETIAEENLRGSGERIILVDDEPLLVDIGKRNLSMNGYEVTTYTNAMQALETFRHQPHAFDLIITDMTMPYMTGADLAMQALSIRPEMPIILCTGQSEIINQAKAYSMGISEYLNKPILKKELLMAVKRVIRK